MRRQSYNVKIIIIQTTVTRRFLRHFILTYLLSHRTDKNLLRNSQRKKQDLETFTT